MSGEKHMPDGYNERFLTKAQAQWHEISYHSSITMTERSMNVLLPYGYRKEKAYPVLYLLHGIGGDENEWKGAGLEYMLSNLLAEKEIEEFITVLPNVRTRADDRGNPEDIFTLPHFQAFDMFREELEQNVMPCIAGNFSIKGGRENTAVAGLSMGGREALYIGLTRPGIFGYTGAFSPAYGIFPYTNNGVTEKGLFDRKDFRLPDAYKDSTFLMLANGNHDEVTREQCDIYHTVLLENSTEHLYQIYAGGHDFTVWSHGLYEFVQHIFHTVSK